MRGTVMNLRLCIGEAAKQDSMSKTVGYWRKLVQKDGDESIHLDGPGGGLYVFYWGETGNKTRLWYEDAHENVEWEANLGNVDRLTLRKALEKAIAVTEPKPERKAKSVAPKPKAVPRQSAPGQTRQRSRTSAARKEAPHLTNAPYEFALAHRPYPFDFEAYYPKGIPDLPKMKSPEEMLYWERGNYEAWVKTYDYHKKHKSPARVLQKAARRAASYADMVARSTTDRTLQGQYKQLRRQWDDTAESLY